MNPELQDLPSTFSSASRAVALPAWARWCVFSMYSALVTWMLLTPARLPLGVLNLFPHVDKLLHFLIFGFYVLIFRWALAAHHRLAPAFYIVVFGSIAYGAAMEVLQLLLAQYHRSFEWLDLASNSLGAITFWLASNRLFPTSSPSDCSAVPSWYVLQAVLKRCFDILFSFAGLVILSPAFAVLAVIVKFSDGGPVFYRQERVGQNSRLFRIVKFRSMVVDADRMGLNLTRDGDPRITRIGRFMRKTKLDELPQLWNVLTGEMSFVGPRPEVPRYASLYSGDQKRVFELKPGITGAASIAFRNEEDLLRHAPDTEKFYIEYCLPKKVELNLDYARKANLWLDVHIVLTTVFGRKLSPAILPHTPSCPAPPKNSTTPDIPLI